MASLVIGLKIAYIFLLHFIADWTLQSKEMSREKSNKLTVLLQHISIHFVVFFFGGLTIMNISDSFLLSLINALVHGVIDWYLWRAYKISVYFRRNSIIPKEKYKEWGIQAEELTLKDFKRMLKSMDLTKDTEEMKYLKTEFKYWDDYWFGFMLGFDQLLHAVTLSIVAAFFAL